MREADVIIQRISPTLARLALYSVSDASPELAMEHLQRAAELSPRNVQVWLELSAVYGFQGNIEKAEAFLRRADFLAPRTYSEQFREAINASPSPKSHVRS